MSRDGSIILEWGDGEYVFRLAEGELEKLEQECDAGPGWVLERLTFGTPENKGWRIGDVRAVIRLGLIGGGMDAIKARRLCDEYLPKSAPYENVVKAQAILGAALIWPKGDLPEKKDEGEATDQPGLFPEENGTGLQSSGSGPQ